MLLQLYQGHRLASPQHNHTVLENTLLYTGEYTDRVKNLFFFSVRSRTVLKILLSLRKGVTY